MADVDELENEGIDPSPPRAIVVCDVRMPFLSMVAFMVKWALASIPAFLILFFLFMFAFVFLYAGIAGLTSGFKTSASSGTDPNSSFLPPMPSTGTDVGKSPARAHSSGAASRTARLESDRRRERLAYLEKISLSDVRIEWLGAEGGFRDCYVSGHVQNGGDRRLQSVTGLLSIGDGFEKRLALVSSATPLGRHEQGTFRLWVQYAPEDTTLEAVVALSDLEF